MSPSMSTLSYQTKLGCGAGSEPSSPSTPERESSLPVTVPWITADDGPGKGRPTLVYTSTSFRHTASYLPTKMTLLPSISIYPLPTGEKSSVRVLAPLPTLDSLCPLLTKAKSTPRFEESTREKESGEWMKRLWAGSETSLPSTRVLSECSCRTDTTGQN